MKIKQKLAQRVQKTNSLLCVGLDSDFDKLPANFKKTSHPQFEFNKWIISKTHKYVSSYKPNLAFYEAAGAKGWEDLRLTISYLHEHHPDIVTIADAKRADIDSTNRGYVQAVFDYLGFDAITLHPYLGRQALEPFLSRTDKACIILCKTSNPGAGEFQDLKVGGKPLWQLVAEKVSKHWNQNDNCMLVVGATYPSELAVVRHIVGDMDILIPGIGTQGGDLQSVLKSGLNSHHQGLIINSARSLIFASNPQQAARQLHQDINLLR